MEKSCLFWKMGRSWCRKFEGSGVQNALPLLFGCALYHLWRAFPEAVIWKITESRKSTQFRYFIEVVCFFIVSFVERIVWLKYASYPYHTLTDFRWGYFFELLRKRLEKNCLKNALLSAVFKKFTNKKGYTNICFVSFSISFLINRLSTFLYREIQYSGWL